MKRCIILEIYDYDITYRYGFNDIRDLCDYLCRTEFFGNETSCYIYYDWLNKEKIERFDIKMVE